LIKNLPAFMPSLSWSPGGTMLAFADTNGTAWLANGDGSGLRRLFSAPAGSDSNPVWSPDGRRLAANLAGTPEHHTNTRLVSATVHNPSWSPDGRRLIGLQGDGDNRVVVVDLASGNERVIYEDKGIGYVTLVDPAWSPANVIAFAEVDSGTIDLYDMRRRMFVGPRRRIEGTEPAWSPDGRRLAYHTAGGIYVADADGTGRRLVARNAAQPAWSPDGRQIAFVRTLAGGNTEIFVADADGSRQRRLTFNPGPDLAPDWQPRPR
jgi:Tol biopolymer transport system component